MGEIWTLARHYFIKRVIFNTVSTLEADSVEISVARWIDLGHPAGVPEKYPRRLPHSSRTSRALSIFSLCRYGGWGAKGSHVFGHPFSDGDNMWVLL